MPWVSRQGIVGVVANYHIATAMWVKLSWFVECSYFWLWPSIFILSALRAFGLFVWPVAVGRPIREKPKWSVSSRVNI